MEKWTDELYVYRQGSVPPEMPLQEYIEKYLEEKDPKWIEAYLYYNENRINEEVRGFVQDYAMQGHFMDLKSAYVIGILNALEHYDPKKGSFSRSYQRHYVKRAIDDYILRGEVNEHDRAVIDRYHSRSEHKRRPISTFENP